MIGIAFTLVIAMGAMFLLIEWLDHRMNRPPHHGTPPPDPNEDDPDFMRHVERQVRRQLED